MHCRSLVYLETARGRKAKGVVSISEDGSEKSTLWFHITTVSTATSDGITAVVRYRSLVSSLLT